MSEGIFLALRHFIVVKDDLGGRMPRNPGDMHLSNWQLKDSNYIVYRSLEDNKHANSQAHFCSLFFKSKALLQGWKICVTMEFRGLGLKP